MKEKIGIYLVYLGTILVAGLDMVIGISRFDILFFAFGTLHLSSILLLISVRGSRMRKSESIDKGKKLAEAIDNPWKSKQIVAGVIVYGCGLLVAVIFGVIEIIQGNTKFINYLIPQIGPLLAALCVLSPRKCCIYENGIQYGPRFVKWDEIKDFEWKNGVLRIRAKGVKELLLEDEKGNIRKIVERMMKK